MPVTELALLHLTSSSPGVALSHLRAALAIQNQWHAQTYPHLPPTFPGSVCFQSVSDPTEILITARWESVAAHWAWIKSDDNAGVMGTLEPYISQEGNEDFSLLHVEGDISGEAPGEGVGLLESPVFSVHCLEVGARREEFDGVVDEWKRCLATTTALHMIRAGWREDPESEERQEYVVVGGWESEERGREAEQAGEFAEKLGTMVKVKYYKRIL